MAKKAATKTNSAKSSGVMGMIMNALKIFFIQFIARKLLRRR
jgi:hypothetical protein